jgi:8-amino-7-oxononanoate synthase
MNATLLNRVKEFTRIKDWRDQGVYPYSKVIESEQDTEVVINGKKILMFGSNSYLGLTNHPLVKEAAIEATRKYGTGCAGSRFLNGTLDLHIELEELLAKFLKREAVMVYSTGFQANIGALGPLVGRQDLILIDERVHASIIEATRLTYGRVLKFKHNDMADLARLLEKADPEQLKYIVVDGIFSMEGDIADLPEITRLAEKHNCMVVVDDAHAVGVIGELGIGTGSHFGIHDKVDMQIGTFSKSFASLGGFIATNSEVADYLKHTSRSYLFSASMPPSAVASVIASVNILQAEPERLAQLQFNTDYCIQRLKKLGFVIGNTSSPIVPVFIFDEIKTFLFSKMCFDAGLFVNPVVSPAVPPNECLVRFSLMATHSIEQIDRAIDIMYKIAKQLDIVRTNTFVPTFQVINKTAAA